MKSGGNGYCEAMLFFFSFPPFTTSISYYMSQSLKKKNTIMVV